MHPTSNTRAWILFSSNLVFIADKTSRAPAALPQVAEPTVIMGILGYLISFHSCKACSLNLSRFIILPFHFGNNMLDFVRSKFSIDMVIYGGTGS